MNGELAPSGQFEGASETERLQKGRASGEQTHACWAFPVAGPAGACSSSAACPPALAPSSLSPGGRSTGAGLAQGHHTFPSVAGSGQPGPSATCLLLVPHGVLQCLYRLQLVLVALQQCSLWLLSLV